jgi:hypothetical protein
MAANKYLAIIAGKVKEVYASVTSTPNAVVAMDSTGKLDISVMPVGITAEVTLADATEALSAGNFVNLYLSGGVTKCRKADATSNGKPANGFVLAAVSSGAQATVYRISKLNNQLTGLTIGADYYLDTTAGGVTVTPPSATGNLVQYLGRATSATELVFSNENTIEIA